MVSYNIPNDVIEKFSQKASENLKIETLAYLIGFKNDYIITVTDLVIPRQKASAIFVDDEGIKLIRTSIILQISSQIKYFICFLTYEGIPTENGMVKNTSAWILNDSPMKEKYGSKLSVVAWAHSHVQGLQCSFSATDVHTQFTWSKSYPDILGLVFELDQEGFLKNYDMFGLTKPGNQNVKKCILPGNQCDKCDENSNYASFKHFVNWFDGSLEVHDYSGLHSKAWLPMVMPEENVKPPSSSNDIQLEKRHLTYDEVIELTPVRLEKAGFCLKEETPGDGNCWIHAILNQMKYVYVYLLIFCIIIFGYMSNLF